MVTVPSGVNVCTVDVPLELLLAVNKVIGEVLDVVFPILIFQVIPSFVAFCEVVEAMSVFTFVIVTDFPPLSRHEPNFCTSSVEVACGILILSLQRKYSEDVAISEERENTPEV